MHNDHVYKYYRFLGWAAGQIGKYWSQEIIYGLADLERAEQAA